MITEKEFNDLKKKSEAARSESDKAVGAYDEKLAKLKTDFGVETLGKAEVLLDEIEDEEKKAVAAYETAFNDFKEKLGDKI